MDKTNINIFPINKIVKLNELGNITDGKAQLKKMFHSEHITTALALFDKDTIVAAHKSIASALVQVLEGTVLITIDGIDYTLEAGESIVIDKNLVHSLQGVTRSKAYITKLFD